MHQGAYTMFTHEYTHACPPRKIRRPRTLEAQIARGQASGRRIQQYGSVRLRFLVVVRQIGIWLSGQSGNSPDSEHRKASYSTQ